MKFCKLFKFYMCYIMKEDYNVVVYNIDKEFLNDNYIMFNFVKQS